MYAVDAQGNESLVRIWTDYAQTIDLNGKRYISRIQELYGPEMHLQELWTNLFEYETLLPYRASQFKTTGDHLYLEFEKDKVNSSTKSGNSDAIKKAYSLDEPVYDWTMYGVLLSGIPFSKGSVTELPVFNQQAATGKVKLVATVVDQESIQDDRGQVHSTWKVSTNFGLTFWLTKAAPYVIQLTLPTQNGGHMIWRMF